MARGELHVQLHVDYADDEKLADVSRSARLLYVDALCRAKRMLNDGILTPAQVDKLMYPERPAAAQKAAAELVATGAWTWDKDRQVYIIAAWLKRNKSRLQIETERREAEEAGLLGNHKRWHEGQGRTDPKCRLCRESPSPPPSPPRSGAAKRVVSPETETETETETEKKNPPVAPPASSARGRATRIPDDFVVTPDMVTWAREETPHIDGRYETAKFIDYWRAKSGQSATKKDWVATWRNWMRKANESRPSNVVAFHRPSTTDQRVAAALQLAAKYAEEDAR